MCDEGKMNKIVDILAQYDFNDSFLLGYYGGGNYGDELLLEILQNLLRKNRCNNIHLLYLSPKSYRTFHKDFKYPITNGKKKSSILYAIRSHRNIIVGGGGLWGLDMNLNTFLMSIMLFGARYILRKKVYLLGVGYYDSTNWLGRIGAWLAGKSAVLIIARDEETYRNFEPLNQKTIQGTDIAWCLPDINLEQYESELKKLETRLDISPKTLFISLRRFESKQRDFFNEDVLTVITDNPKKNIIVALFEPKAVDPKNWQRLVKWQKKFPNVQIIDCSYNPVALYLFFKKHRKNLIFIGPQFHAILTAFLAGVPFLPITYDNKVSQLFRQIGQDNQIAIEKVKVADIQKYINQEIKTQSNV